MIWSPRIDESFAHNTLQWTQLHFSMMGMKTVWFSIFSWQLNCSCLFFTECRADLQQWHCFSKYGAVEMTTSNDLHVPEQVGTFVKAGSQSGHSTVIVFLFLIQSPSSVLSCRVKVLIAKTRMSRYAVNIFTDPSNCTKKSKSMRYQSSYKENVLKIWKYSSTASYQRACIMPLYPS